MAFVVAIFNWLRYLLLVMGVTSTALSISYIQLTKHFIDKILVTMRSVYKRPLADRFFASLRWLYYLHAVLIY